MELEKCLDQLNKLWPELNWKDAKILDYDHDVVFLDNSYIFRFACDDPEHEPLEREVKFVNKLRQKGLPVPDYTHIDSEFQVAGYPPLPGHSLTYEKFIALSRKQRRDIAIGVADVLSEVHAFPISEAKEMEIPQDDPWYEEVRGFLFRYILIVRQGSLTNSELSFCDEVIKAIMNTDLSAEIPRSVIHGDIEPPHILLDGTSFTGVIDFGDILIGDRACDLGWLWELGEEFIDDFLAQYRYSSEDVKQRGYWFWFSRAMREMEWGFRSGRKSNWERGYRFFPKSVADPKRSTGFSEE